MNTAYNFPLDEGGRIPQDNGYPILAALSRQHPFVHGRYDLQIAPVRGTRMRKNHAYVVTDRFSRLHVRGLSQDEASALEDSWIYVGGSLLHIGKAEEVGVKPSSLLVSRLVVLTDIVDKEDFLAEVKNLVKTSSVQIGKRKSIRVKGRHYLGYPVVLRDLSAEESLRIQQRGIGRFTSMGCGVFYPGSRKLDRSTP